MTGRGLGDACDVSGRSGGGTGLRLGMLCVDDALDDLEPARSGGGRGMPGGGSGLPLPIGFSGVPGRFELATELCFFAWSFLLNTFQPHCFAAAVATPIAVVFLSNGVRDRATDSSIVERLDSPVAEDIVSGLSGVPGVADSDS